MHAKSWSHGERCARPWFLRMLYNALFNCESANPCSDHLAKQPDALPCPAELAWCGRSLPFTATPPAYPRTPILTVQYSYRTFLSAYLPASPLFRHPAPYSLPICPPFPSPSPTLAHIAKSKPCALLRKTDSSSWVKRHGYQVVLLRRGTPSDGRSIYPSTRLCTVSLHMQ